MGPISAVNFSKWNNIWNIFQYFFNFVRTLKSRCMKNILSREEAETLLLPYKQAISRCIIEGYADYQQFDGSRAIMHSKTTRASIIADYIFYRIKKELRDSQEISFIKKNRMNAIIVRNRLLIRFKKLDKNKRSGNIPTKQVSSFREQTLEIEELKNISITCVDAGYVLDNLGLSISSTHLVCPKGKLNDWIMTLDENVTIKNQTSIFSVDPPVDNEKENKRVKIKKNGNLGYDKQANS